MCFHLGNDTILTSAHCLYDGLAAVIFLGAHALSMNDPNAIEVSSNQFIIHPEYNPSTLSNDLGLIKLADPIKFSKG